MATCTIICIHEKEPHRLIQVEGGESSLLAKGVKSACKDGEIRSHSISSNCSYKGGNKYWLAYIAGNTTTNFVHS